MSTRLLPLLAAAAAAALAATAPSQRAQPGFHTELTTTNQRLDIFDLDGRLINTWQNPAPGWAFAELAKPLSNGNVLAMITNTQTATIPHIKKLAQFDWTGQLVWEYDPAPRFLHHDFERLANGNTLMILMDSKLVPSISPQPIWDDIIIEVDPLGNIVWEWSAIAHMSQMPIGPAGWQFLTTKGTSLPRTLFHLNSIQSLPPSEVQFIAPRFSAGNVLVSMRELNLVFVIDKTTQNIVWTLFNETVGQHHARMIENGTPGAGNLLIFDNGGVGGAPRVPYRPYSRVIEIGVAPTRLVWSYACVPIGESAPRCRPQFFSSFMGSAQRLANGNTLINDADSGRVFEVRQNRTTVWERVAPGQQIYRAYRWDLKWPTNPIPTFRW